MLRKLVLLTLILTTAAGCNVLNFGSRAGIMGIAKTLDGGGVWQLANRVDDSNNISGLDVSEIAFENNNHEVVYLGNLNGGFWVSKDSAATWQQLLSTVSVYDFYVDPTNSDNIFVVGLFANHGKIIRSKDAGATWEELYNEATVGNPVNSITGNPNSGNELYAVLSSGVVIKSVDGGVNWFVVNDFKTQSIRIRYNRPNNTLYALTRSS